MDILVLFLLGGAVGFVSSFFGIGGGSLIVPILYMLYPKLPLTIVIPISLGTICIITTINSISFIKARVITNKKMILSFLITCSIGAYAGAKLTYLIDTNIGKKILACVLILSVFKILFYKSGSEKDSDKNLSQPLIAFTGFLGSLISSITGLGGGIVFTPMLISLVKLPLKLVSPYSNIAMSIATFIGIFPHFFTTLQLSHGVSSLPSLSQQFFVGSVNIAMILIMTTTALVGSRIGIKYNDSVDGEVKKNLLAGVISILIIKMFLN
jgi:uncharacterized membrane protein YfcA